MAQDYTDGPPVSEGLLDDGLNHLVVDAGDEDEHDCLPFALSSLDGGTSQHGLQQSLKGVFDFGGGEFLGASLAATSFSNSVSSRESASALSIASPSRSRENGRGDFALMPKPSEIPSAAPGQQHSSGRGSLLGRSDDACVTYNPSLPPSSPPPLEGHTTEGSIGTTQVPADQNTVILPGIDDASNGIPLASGGKERNVSPESSTNTASTANMSDEFQSVFMTQLFPSGQGDDEKRPAGSDSLGFSDLMREADDAAAVTERSFNNVLEAVPEDADENATQSSRQSSAATPMVSNCAATAERTCAGNGGAGGLWGQFFGQAGGGGVTIVPAASGDSLDGLNSQRQPSAYEASSVWHHRRPGGKVQACQLDEDKFSVTTRVPPPCSARDVMDVLASPDLLRLWCAPVRNAIVTREGNGLSNEGGLGSSGESNREYDGEWVEVTTTELVSPPTCGSCLYKCATTAGTYLGFPSHGTVKMFVERNRGQVGLTIGPFAGGAVAQHTIRVHDADSDQNRVNVVSAAQRQTGVTVTDTVRISNEDEGDGYSCGLFDMIGRCLLPGLADYMGQTALSLENLRDLVCAGETSAMAAEGTCSIDFGGGGLQGDDHDGRTPLLAHS